MQIMNIKKSIYNRKRINLNVFKQSNLHIPAYFCISQRLSYYEHIKKNKKNMIIY